MRQNFLILPSLLLALFMLSGCLSETEKLDNSQEGMMSIESLTLESGAHEATITSHQRHVWNWNVPAATFATVDVEQRGIDLEIRLFADGAAAPELVVDGTGGPWEVERLSVCTEAATTYRIEIEPLEAGARSTSYRVVAQKPRSATPELCREAAADRHFDAGERLRRRGRPEDLRAARRAYRRALADYSENSSGQMRALQRLGRMSHRLGELDEARLHYEALLALTRELGERAEEARTLNRLGKLDYDNELLDRAEERFLAARAIAAELEDRSLEAQALNNLAPLRYRREDLTGAIRDFEEAARLSGELGNSADRATTLFNLGAVLQAQGKLEEAIDVSAEGETLRLALGDQRGAAMARLQIANCRRFLAQPSVALADLEAAEQELGDDPAYAAVLASEIASLHVQLGNLQAAIERYEQALQIAEARGQIRYEAMARLNLAAVRRDLGSLDESRALLLRARELFEQLDDRRHLAACDLIDARIDRDSRQPERALTRLEAAVAQVESLRLTHTGWGLRMAFFATRQTYYAELLDLLVERYRDSGDDAYLERALQTAERRRARSLLDALGEGRLSFRGDPALLDEERRLSEELAEVGRELALLETGEDRLALESHQRRLLLRLETTRAEMQRSSPQYAELTRPRPLTVDAIRQQLLAEKKRQLTASPSQTRLLLFELGEQRSFLFSLTAEDPLTLHELPPRQRIEELALAVREALSSLSDERARRHRRLAAELSDMLLGPLAADLGDSRLAIIADGVLHALPFAALPEPRDAAQPRTSDVDEERPFLLERREVVYLPSASTLVALRREAAGRQAARYQVAVFAHPVFSADDARVHTSAATSDSRGEIELLPPAFGLREDLVPLPASAKEAQAIRELAVEDSSRFALSFAASRETFEDPEIEDYAILHFATHGILDAEHPELSGLVLSMVDEQGNPVDGFIRAHELYSRSLKAELVVLSACKTGLGRVVSGEGLIGLPRGFLYAGVPRVVVSLWNVADDSTAVLMASFYRHLEDGIAPAAALRQAQLEMLRSAEPSQQRFRQPFHWAPFIALGDWSGSYDQAGGIGQDDDGNVVIIDISKGGSFEHDADGEPEAPPAFGELPLPEGFVNGIDASTGKLLPVDPTGDPQAMRVDALEWRRLQHWTENRDYFRLPEHGVDPERLDQSGWGVIFAPSVTQLEREALDRLLERRKSQAGPLYQTIEYPGTSAYKFLKKRGVASGRAVPSKLPYYLLLVGAPEDLPFDFQYGVDVQHAVGRLHLPSADDYERYAAAVLAAEDAPWVDRKGVFWGSEIVGDALSRWMMHGLLRPLAGDLDAWRKTRKRGLYATERAADGSKSSLLEQLRRSPPAFLFTTSHGVVFSRDAKKRALHQGALLCEDWQPGEPITPEVFLSADDLCAEDDLQGLIACHFACYSAGCTDHDPFQKGMLGQGKKLHSRPFVSRLSQALLRRGAQAVIGHVDRAWESSFQVEQEGDQTPVIASMLRQLFEGHRLGHATEPINSRYAEMASNLNPLLDQRPRPGTETDQELRSLRLATLDARNYVVIGDPAVRLVGAGRRS